MQNSIFDTHAYIKKPASKHDIMELHTSLQRDMKQMEIQLERKIADTKTELIKWVLGISAAQAALIVTLLKLVK